MAGPISEILSTTLKNWVESDAVDNIMKGHAIWFELRRRNAIKGFAGGERLVAPIEYAKNTLGGAMAPKGKLELQEVDVVTSAEYNWRVYGKPVVLFEFDLRRNRGEHQMVSLLETKSRNAIKSLREDIVTDIFATSQGANSVLNWQSVFRSTGSIGGIAQSSYSWWASQYNNTAEPLTVEDMFNMYNLASGGSDPAKVVVTSQTLYEKYNSLLQANQRFTDSALAAAGFETLKFHAASVIWDEQAISDEMWFWNPDYLYLGVLPEHVEKFEVSPFVNMQANGQWGQVSTIHLMGNFVLTNRRRLGALDGRTA